MAYLSKLISILFNKNLSPSLEKKAQQFLLENKDQEEVNDTLLSEWKNIENSCGNATEESYEHFVKNIKKEKHHSFLHFSFGKTMKIAAVVILTVLCSFLTYFISKNNNTEQEMLHCYVEKGDIKTVALSDGSIVKLNSGTHFYYPKTFAGSTRNVYISGEGYFDVAHNANMPFVVNTDKVGIKVLGTVFNLKVYPEDADVFATLCEGKVVMNFNNSTLKPVEMNPLQQIHYEVDKNSYSLENVDTYKEIAWTNRNLIFKSTQMKDVITQIERRYGVDIEWNAEKFHAEKITVKLIKNESLQETLDVLKKIIPNLKYSIHDNKITIY
jgi:ferric-dicitrate binding protein FerR (iron transport regulator)